MRDPDLEKNNILSAQYKLAIVTIIPMATWEARASISVVRRSYFSIQSSALISKTSRRVFTPVQKAELIGLTQQGVCTEGFFVG